MIDFFKNFIASRSENRYQNIDQTIQDKNKDELIVRKKVIFTGRVQGVGFRFEAYSRAANAGLTGYVKNQEDSSVLLEVQGEIKKVYAFIEDLTMLDRAKVDNVEIYDMEVKNFEVAFKIAY